MVGCVFVLVRFMLLFGSVAQLLGCNQVDKKRLELRFKLKVVFYRFRYAFICLTVKVVFTPLPNVIPTASNAESAISITSPAVNAIIILPL